MPPTFLFNNWNKDLVNNNCHDLPSLCSPRCLGSKANIQLHSSPSFFFLFLLSSAHVSFIDTVQQGPCAKLRPSKGSWLWSCRLWTVPSIKSGLLGISWTSCGDWTSGKGTKNIEIQGQDLVRDETKVGRKRREAWENTKEQEGENMDE